ncbi:hypothetical protein SPHINGOT1_270189 [Sphingomonas sp. T1]|nr:hypothetical protein SPHINGOT1_270189 [Sphingomonas sp. T1]
MDCTASARRRSSAGVDRRSQADPGTQSGPAEKIDTPTSRLIVRCWKHGTLASAPVVATLLDTLGDLHHIDWTRIAAAVDAIDEGRLQWLIPPPP